MTSGPSSCPGCGAASAGLAVCPSCGRLLTPAPVAAVAPSPRCFHAEPLERGVRFIGRVPLVVVIVLLVFVLPVGLLFAFAKVQVSLEGDVVEVRSFAMPTERTGRFPLHDVADAAWTSTPAKNGGLEYRAALVLADGATIGLGFYGGQPEVLHIVAALRGALVAQKKTMGSR